MYTVTSGSELMLRRTRYLGARRGVGRLAVAGVAAAVVVLMSGAAGATLSVSGSSAGSGSRTGIMGTAASGAMPVSVGRLGAVIGVRTTLVVTARPVGSSGDSPEPLRAQNSPATSMIAPTPAAMMMSMICRLRWRGPPSTSSVRSSMLSMSTASWITGSARRASTGWPPSVKGVTSGGSWSWSVSGRSAAGSWGIGTTGGVRCTVVMRTTWVSCSP